MRTKALLLTAAIGAAGIATSMAQVYSVNAVGYVNVTVPVIGNPSYAILANPLNGTNNNIKTILPSVPVGATVLKFDPALGFSDPETYFGPAIGWDPGTMNLNPGEGFFVALDAAGGSTATFTFVGEVPQGNLTNDVRTGYNLLSSQVPQSGAVQSVLGLNATAGDTILLWLAAVQQYSDPYTYFGAAIGWDPAEPVIEVGTGFFILSGSNYSWGRSFTVN
jgi:hypothetical protein